MFEMQTGRECPGVSTKRLCLMNLAEASVSHLPIDGGQQRARIAHTWRLECDKYAQENPRDCGDRVVADLRHPGDVHCGQGTVGRVSRLVFDRIQPASASSRVRGGKALALAYFAASLHIASGGDRPRAGLSILRAVGGSQPAVCGVARGTEPAARLRFIRAHAGIGGIALCAHAEPTAHRARSPSVHHRRCWRDPDRKTLERGEVWLS